uniref:Uncharacterized protein n=1 Tax=Chromera velia CCMP2878 TaxID=1169474 RepID=A0A0G4HF39_9ALVE|eukprot:Cvel_6564.t1-p1 / transcript=Cvel_6564.t1 / gene=Cvel_6564 / organism=Chromera_velia_CCMP2878 / gene_product=hypothetical protein / transcript_product=hypothetical protein / location=Cvel_scaffold323:76205-77452(-) / protein_length=416 / sequence_SO=supercontig / SO=protein_coding / is_pseudo=false
MTEAAWRREEAERAKTQQSSDVFRSPCPQDGEKRVRGGRRKRKKNHCANISRAAVDVSNDNSIIQPGNPQSKYLMREGAVQNRGSSPGEKGFGMNLTCPAVPFQGADRGELSRGGNDWRGGVPTHDDNDHVGQSSRKEGGETCKMQEESGFVNTDGGVIFVMPQTTFDFGQSSPVMAPARGDGQMNEPAPMELCRIERCWKEERGVGKDLFESLYGVGSWKLREQIHCQSGRPHSPSPQLNRLETGRQGNDFDGGNPGKVEREKQKRQEKKERKRQEKHEREMLAVRQKKETDNPGSPLPPISEGVEEPAVPSDGLTPSRQVRRQQERRETKNKEKEKRRAAHGKPTTPVPPRDPLQHEYWEDVSFRFRLGREDLIPNVQRIGTADWDTFLARRGCRQTGETFYREMYGNGGGHTV